MTERRAAQTAFINAIRPHVAAVRTADDDSLLLRLRGGEDVLVYLVSDDAALLPTPLRRIVHKNTTRHIHTLFLFAESVLPAPGQLFDRRALRREAFRLLLDLYWGKLYSYRLGGGELVIQPVYSDQWRAVYGAPVEPGLIDCDTVYLEPPYKGVFNVANFGGRHAPATWTEADPLHAFYDLLGVAAGADEDAVKYAYRQLARQYHPDANPSPEANAMMQRINEAYEQIMARLRG